VSDQENASLPVASPVPAQLPRRENVEDDIDDSDGMPDEEPLHGILQRCQEGLLPTYQRVDGAAMRFQKRYRTRALTVALLGSAAVVMATLQLSGLARYVLSSGKLWLVMVSEATAAISTMLIVVLGMGSSLKEQWLLARYKAERLRLLKFRTLFEPGLWSGVEAEVQNCKDRLCDQVEDVAATSYDILRGWIAQGTVPKVHPPPPPERLLTLKDLVPLIHYYRSKRLHYQMAYLTKAVRRDQGRDRHTRVVGPVLFFGSVAFVLAHLAVEIGHGTEDWSRLLILMAAALPVMGAGFRMHRAANEFARNAARFEAVHSILSELSQRLRLAPDAAAVFREIGFIEQTFEADLREWMRLMVEAEWFG
jgi:hypothetical protein